LQCSPSIEDTIVGSCPTVPGDLWIADVSRCAPSPVRSMHRERAVPYTRGVPWGAGLLGPSLGCSHECFDISLLRSSRGHTSRRDGLRGCSARASASREDTVPQERTACPAIALAFEQLQTVAMTLDGTIAPRKREPCCDCREVVSQALGKAGQRLNPAGRCLSHNAPAKRGA
jgi:hypothetical protein